MLPSHPFNRNLLFCRSIDLIQILVPPFNFRYLRTQNINSPSGTDEFLQCYNCWNLHAVPHPRNSCSFSSNCIHIDPIQVVCLYVMDQISSTTQCLPIIGLIDTDCARYLDRRATLLTVMLCVVLGPQATTLAAHMLEREDSCFREFLDLRRRGHRIFFEFSMQIKGRHRDAR